MHAVKNAKNTAKFDFPDKLIPLITAKVLLCIDP